MEAHVMKAKVTLTLEKELIEEAKEYARTSGLTLSAIVERYLRSLLDEKQSQEKDHSPWVEEFPGLAPFDREFDSRDYANYLIDWYQ
jgi:hypothetical protein